MLPCIHNFCLECLEKTGIDKQPGENMSCPLCRKEFKIPDEGIKGIRKNFFIEKFIEVLKKDEVERHVAMLQSFTNYATEMEEKGSDVDICRAFVELKRNADELEKNHIVWKKSFEHLESTRTRFFTPFAFEEYIADENVIGKISNTRYGLSSYQFK